MRGSAETLSAVCLLLPATVVQMSDICLACYDELTLEIIVGITT